MSIKERIEADYIIAFKAKEAEKTSCLRMLKAAIKYCEIDAKGPLGDEGLISLLATEVKKRQESVEQFSQGGRQELADKEAAEITLIRQYLPTPLSEPELATLIDEAVREAGADSPKQMGAVMKILAPKVKGRADGKKVSALVQEKLKPK